MISGDITNSSRDVLSQDEVLTKKSNPDSCHLDDPKPLPKRYTQESASRTGLPSRTHIRWRSQPERWRPAVSWKGLVKRTRVQAASITLLQNLVLWHKNTSNESISYIKAGHTNLKIYPVLSNTLHWGSDTSGGDIIQDLKTCCVHDQSTNLHVVLDPASPSVSVVSPSVATRTWVWKARTLGNPLKIILRFKCFWDRSILVKTQGSSNIGQNTFGPWPAVQKQSLQRKGCLYDMLMPSATKMKHCRGETPVSNQWSGS